MRLMMIVLGSISILLSIPAVAQSMLDGTPDAYKEGYYSDLPPPDTSGPTYSEADALRQQMERDEWQAGRDRRVNETNIENSNVLNCCP